MIKGTGIEAHNRKTVQIAEGRDMQRHRVAVFNVIHKLDLKTNGDLDRQAVGVALDIKSQRSAQISDPV